MGNIAGLVLIVDDDPETQMLVGMVLRMAGYSPLAAGSGPEGLKLMRERSPDLVILDLLMPEMDGWAVVQAKNQDPRLVDLPVIILTASDQMIDRTMAEHVAHARAFIVKPFEPADLVAAVRRAIGVPAGPITESGPDRPERDGADRPSPGGGAR